MQIKSFDKYKPSLDFEKKIRKQGYLSIAGIDEAGRGALAGPVVAVAVSFSNSFSDKILLSEVRDSKQLSGKKRSEIFQWIKSSPDISYKIGIISPKIIDQINILQATKKAMMGAVNQFSHKPNALIVDGNFSLVTSIKQYQVIGGDQKILSVAIASILAKVTRDKIMLKYHSLYPQYYFAQHKGYGTKLHYQMLNEYGPSPIHRSSFRLFGAWQNN
jgi:ribonuclease HII